MNLDDIKELKRCLGFGVNLNSDEDRQRLTEVINAKLWFRGQPTVGKGSEFSLLKTSKHLFSSFMSSKFIFKKNNYYIARIKSQGKSDRDKK